ncbi:MAG TPA: DegT/DnrJ/EryC1/StrS family aminotransferase [Bryobacteraceae bacterium]|nr:DegT/DnrJ/EryC1/StrS family aminotransferase [Bryobacteraceae bacterium]
MDIPVTSLRAVLDRTRESWQANLEQLYRDAWFILGPQVKAFELEFAEAHGARHAVGCASGTDAINLLLRSAGITSRSQRVLTSALTAPFTGIAILSAGATPTFADIDPETLQIDANDAAARLTKNVAALLPVHLYGQPCRIDQFVALAKQHSVALFQDACQAHGAYFHARQPLTHFSAAAYSFYPTKNLGCLGDGGAILTNDGQLAERLRILRNGGRQNDQLSRLPEAINSRLDEMQACYLRAFLPSLEEWNAERASYAKLYNEAFAGMDGLRLPRREPCCVWHLYVILTPQRDALREHLARHSIGTGIHYPVPLHLNPAFDSAGLRKGDLPHAERACDELLSLPLWPGLGQSAALRVIETVQSFFRQ